MYFALAHFNLFGSIFKYNLIFITQNDNKSVINLTVSVDDFAVVHVQSNDLLLVVYNTICNTSIIQIHKEYSPVQGI